MKAVIVGGGIVGLSAAYYLKQTGWDVTVIDKTDISDNCSFGNMGMIMPGQSLPFKIQSLFSKSIHDLFTPPGSVNIGFPLSFNLFSWYLRYFISPKKDSLQHYSALVQLNLLSNPLFQHLARSIAYPSSFENKGIMVYYKSLHGEAKAYRHAEIAHANGFQIGVLRKKDVEYFEPGIHLDISGAFHFITDSIVSAGKTMETLCTKLVRAGVSFQLEETVEKIVVEKNLAKKVITKTGETEGDIIVLAGGSWLPGLTKMVGFHLPVIPFKGYSFAEKKPAACLNHAAYLTESGVYINPIDGHMRYGAMLQPGKLHGKINLGKVKGMVHSVNSFFPGLNVKMPPANHVWTGYTPCTPDGLPYIGFVPKFNNLLVAGGNGINGFGMGPGTGMIIAELANGRPNSMDIKVFDPSRFYRL